MSTPKITPADMGMTVTQEISLDNAEVLGILTAPETRKSTETAPQTAEPVVPDEIMAIFLEEVGEILENTQSLLKRWQAAPHNMQLMKEFQREIHTLKSSARLVGIIAMEELGHSLESVLTKIVEGGGTQSNPKLQEMVQNSVDELAAMLRAVRSGVPLESPIGLIASLNKIIEEIVPVPEPNDPAAENSTKTTPIEEIVPRPVPDPMGMVPFSRISPRLQRIVRLVTRELRKPVDFIINGEQIECQRIVLNNLVRPLEYILRGAIAYDVEDVETRQRAGKPAITKMTLDIGKKGTELIVKLST